MPTIGTLPHLVVHDLRGNVQTRLNKLDEGQFDAIILAASGLIRLDLSARIKQRIPVDICLPANGQGVLGIECRSDDADTKALLAPLTCADTRSCVLAERAMNRRLQGGCQVPIGAFAELEGDDIVLRGLVGRPDGSEVIEGDIRGHRDDAEALGTELAEFLLSRGAGKILQDVYAANELQS